MNSISQVSLGYVATANSPNISVADKQQVFMFPSLYLLSAGQMSCLCSVCLLHSGSWAGEQLLSRVCDSLGRTMGWRQKLCSGVAHATNWFHQNRGLNTMQVFPSNSHICTLRHHVWQHSSTCMYPWGWAHHALRQVSLTRSLWSLRCVSPPECVVSCVWHLQPHASLPSPSTPRASWGILRLLPQSSLGSMEVLSCPDLELPPMISKWCHSWRLWDGGREGGGEQASW